MTNKVIIDSKRAIEKLYFDSLVFDTCNDYEKGCIIQGRLDNIDEQLDELNTEKKRLERWFTL